MKKYLVGIIFVVCCGRYSHAQTIGVADSLRIDRISRDSVFIHKLAGFYSKHSKNILQLFDNCNREADDLGFGYYSVEGFYRSGDKSNININYQFIFRGEKLISYQMIAALPAKQSLIDVYRKLYAGLFEFKTNAMIGERSVPIYYNYSDMAKPLTGIRKSVTRKIDKQIQFLMTPFSGTMYGGEITGYIWAKLPNRACYESVKNQITPEMDYMLLYSINPATRLLAIEYYYQHPELFNDKAAFEARIRAIYKEVPIVTTIIGTTHTNQNAEELVRTYANAH